MQLLADSNLIYHLCIFLIEQFHSALLDEEPSAMDFLLRFMQHDDVSFIHLALWILSQFSNGSKDCYDKLCQRDNYRSRH